jgi:phosphatidate cytidylyltransferase
MTRVLSALVLLPVVVGTIWFLPSEGTLVLALLAAVLAFSEYCQLSSALGVSVPGGIGGTAVALVCFEMWFADRTPLTNSTHLVLVVAMIVIGGAAVARGRPYSSVLADAGATLFAPVYIGLPLGSLAALRAGTTPDGRWLVLLLLLTIVVSDSAQYYTGRALGKRPLSPAISPKKTVEGAIGGVVFGTIAMVIGGRYVFDTPLWVLALLGSVIVLLGIVGDLFESLLKRSAGVKDSSHLIPGHGGVLDRIDSWLFAAPVYYVFVRFVAS